MQQRIKSLQRRQHLDLTLLSFVALSVLSQRRAEMACVTVTMTSFEEMLAVVALLVLMFLFLV
jgi:hypothetical protein